MSAPVKAHYIVTKEDNNAYMKGPVNKDFLQKEIKGFSKPFYVYGPDELKKIKGITTDITEIK